MRLFTILLDLASRISTGENWIQIGPFLIQFGSVQIQTTAATDTTNGFGTTTLTYPKAYSTAPRIWLQDDIGGDYLGSCAPANITTQNVTIKVIHTRERQTSINIAWLAIGLA